MEITAIAGAAVSASFDRLGAAGAAVSSSVGVTAAASGDTGDTGDTIDISSAAIELSQAKLQTQASINLLKVANEMEQYTLDLFA